MVKCLMTWSWNGVNDAEVTQRFRNWKPIGDVKFYYPIHTVIGAKKAFTVLEVDDINTLAKNVTGWLDICDFKVQPIMDSRELIAME